MIITKEDIEKYNGLVTTNMSFNVDLDIFDDYYVKYEPFIVGHTLHKFGLWLVYECLCENFITVNVHIPIIVFDGKPECIEDYSPDASITTFKLRPDIFAFKFVSLRDSWSYKNNNYRAENISYVNRHVFGRHWKEIVEETGSIVIMEY